MVNKEKSKKPGLQLELVYLQEDGHEFVLKINNVVDSLTKDQVKKLMDRLMHFEWITDLKGKSRFPNGIKPKLARYTHRSYQMLWQQNEKVGGWMG